jgi:hypothetical protein
MAKVYTGVVVSSNVPVGTEILYTVDVNIGGGVVRYTGIKNQMRIVPADMDTRAAPAGTMCILMEDAGGQMIPWIPEAFDYAPCASEAQ